MRFRRWSLGNCAASGVSAAFAASFCPAAITPPADQPRLRVRHAILLADALVAAGQKDAAKAALTPLAAQFPNDQRLKRKLQELGG